MRVAASLPKHTARFVDVTLKVLTGSLVRLRLRLELQCFRGLLGFHRVDGGEWRDGGLRFRFFRPLLWWPLQPFWWFFFSCLCLASRQCFQLKAICGRLRRVNAASGRIPATEIGNARAIRTLWAIRAAG